MSVTPPAAPPVPPRRWWMWGLIVAMVALVFATWLLVRRPPAQTTAVYRATAPPRAGSVWRVLASAGAAMPGGMTETVKKPTRTGLEPALVVVVEDATGGPIVGAEIGAKAGFGHKAAPVSLGRTDGTGTLVVPVGRLEGKRGQRRRTGFVSVTAAGYAPGLHAYAAPGTLRSKLLPGSRISGVVVEADTGRPVPGLTVQADDYKTISDREGRFAFEDLTASFYPVEARGPRHRGALENPVLVGPGGAVSDVRLRVVPAFAIRGRILVQGQPLSKPGKVAGAGTSSPLGEGGRYELLGVAPGEHELDLDAQGFGLPTKALAKVVDRDVTVDIDLTARDGVTVAVFDRRGTPVPGVTVGGRQRSEAGKSLAFCTTETTGSCRFDGLWPGVTKIGINVGDEAREFRVPAAGPVRLRLTKSGRIEGKLVCADGRAPRERRVQLESRAGLYRSERSGPDGGFVFDHLPGGRYTIEVEKAFVDLLLPHEPPESRIELDLAPHENRRDLRVTLAAEDGRITGQLRGSAGDPIPDVLVHADPGPRDQRGALPLTSQDRFVVTDLAGRFVLDRLPRQYVYNVRAYSSTGQKAWLEKVAPGQDVVLALPELTSLTVFLEDLAGRIRPPCVEVLEWNNVALVAARFSQTPNAVHIEGLMPGLHVVRAHCTAAEWAVEHVTLAAGKAQTITITTQGTTPPRQ